MPTTTVLTDFSTVFTADFNTSFTYLMENEGGDKYVDNPYDSGGPTKYGISLRYLRQLKNDESLTSDDIRSLTESEAQLICRDQFWVPLGCSKSLHQGPATVILDMGYLEGVKSCGLITQSVLKAQGYPMDLDGILGPISWDYINESVPHMFINALVDAQLSHYERLVMMRPSDAANLKGWIKRTNRLLSLC